MSGSAIQVLLVKTRDRRNSPQNLLWLKWRLAAYLVPCEQELRYDLWIDITPQQMSGQKGYGGVTLTLNDAFPQQVTPV